MNSDLSDVATALTASLPRDGQAGMLGQLKNVDGSSLLPSISFSADPTTGFYHAGAGQIGIVVSGAQVGTISSAGINGTAPIGTVVDYAGPTAPSLWLLCFGQAISRTTYAALFVIIGTIYGVGDGSTTFNVPDLRGTITAGLDNMGGAASGRLITTWYGSDPTIEGNRGGNQNHLLTLSELPGGINSVGTNTINVTSILTDIVFDSGGLTNSTNAATGSGPPKLLTANGGIGGVASSGLNNIAVTANNTGGLAHANVQPTLVMNKIIFAGV